MSLEDKHIKRIAKGHAYDHVIACLTEFGSAAETSSPIDSAIDAAFKAEMTDYH